MLRIPFTEIQDRVGMKRRSESEDMPIFENVAKCEHPCHSYTNEYGIAGLDKIWNMIKENGMSNNIEMSNNIDKEFRSLDP